MLARDGGGSGVWAGDLDGHGVLRAAAEAARAAPSGPAPPRAVDVLLDGFALRLTEGYAAAAPTLTRALRLVLALDVANDEVGRWLWLAGGRATVWLVALELWDAESWHAHVTAQAQFAWISERTEGTRVTPSEWALGIQARVRALLSEGEVADRRYRESIDRLGRTRVRVELARAHLRYGEWLRRQGRRVDAREQLRTAHDLLEAMGVEAFAERARRELRATGETARKRTVETSAELTTQEALIARLARDGLSNPEIGTNQTLASRRHRVDTAGQTQGTSVKSCERGLSSALHQP